MSESSNYSRTWRPVVQPPTDGGKSSRRLRVAILAAVLLALSGALMAWLTYIWPFQKADFLPLCISEYGDDFPVRPWVRQDGESLGALNWNASNTFTDQKRELLLQELRAFTARKPDGPLVVYLNGLAQSTPKGELCLLAVDAALDRPDTWLPLREVFKQLRTSKAKHKLLLLDIMQPFADARQGVLCNNAAERLQPLLDEVLPEDPNLSVLCACSPGQTSLTAEEQGHSVFAHYLQEGLRGQADGINPRHPSDGRVSLGELKDYVTQRVERWAWQHRNARQTPRLHGAQDDYPLVAVDLGAGTETESPLEAEYPPWLSDGWKLRDQWWDDESYRYTPETFRQLEAALLRAEQQWRGGVSVERVRRDLTARRERLGRQRSEGLPIPDTAMPDSLAKATDAGRKPPQGADDEAIVAIRRLALRQARIPAGKPGEEEQKKLTADTEQQLKKFADKPLALAWVVFMAVDADAATPKALRFLADLLTKARVPLYAETRLLSRLADLPAMEEGTAESIRLAPRMAWEAEKVAVGDPRAQPWVREVRVRADRLRREGETLLFGREAAARRRAEEPLRMALKAYRAIGSDLQTVESALRCRDEMLMRLPRYAPYLQIDASTEQTWEQDVETSGKLRHVLAAAVAPPGSGHDGQIRDMAELTAALRHDPNSPNSLRRPLDPEHFGKLIARSEKGDLADGKIMTALLETPWPRADQRAQLWTARHTLLGLLGRHRAEDSIPARDETRAVAAERQRALQRARRSLALLKLEGVGSLDKIETALDLATQTPADTVRLGALAQELRQAWARRTLVSFR